MKTPKQENIWILFILGVAGFLRFFNIQNAEFGYDELSAIFRAQNAHNWAEHLQNGVMPDGHPAGLQTFIWLWIQYFGLTLLGLKTAMGLCSIASVYFIYKIGKNTLNAYAGISAAVLLSILFIPLEWSTQLRPYSPGLMVVLLSIWMLTEIVFNHKTRVPHFFLLGIGILLSFYLHYFAALTVCTAFVGFWLMADKKQKWKFLALLFVSFFCFFPHLQITLHQFSNKGLNWLGKPQSSFFNQHIVNVFSGSTFLLAIVFILSIAGFISAYKNNLFTKTVLKRIMLFWTIFFIPLATGYFYSVCRAPVLQHSVLLFSISGFLIFLSIFLGFIPFALQKIQWVLILFIGISVLVEGRKYYSEANENAYKQELLYCNAYSNSLGKDSVTVWIDGANDVLEYYIQKYFVAGISYNRVSHYSPQDIIHFIQKNSRQRKYLAVGLQAGTDANFRTQLEDYFGTALHTVNFNAGEFLLFNTENSARVKYHFLSDKKDAQLDFKNTNAFWTDFIVIRTKSTGISGEIQTAIFSDDKQIDWRSSKLKKWHFVPWDNEFSENFHVLKLADIPGWNPGCKMRVQVVSDSTQNKMIVSEFKGIEYRVAKGNPYIYGIKINTNY